MKVMIMDATAPAFVLLGLMDAVPGMRSTAGNVIKSVNGNSCQVQIDGRLHRKTDVCIDLKVALEFGWVHLPAASSPPPPPTKRTRAAKALARNAAAGKQKKRGGAHE